MEEILKMFEEIGGKIEEEIRHGIENVCSEIHEANAPECCNCRCHEQEEEKEEITPAEYLFLHLAELKSLVSFGIKKVIFADEDKKTIVIFTDGTRQIATCSGNDIYSRETGIMVCILKRIYGNSINDMLNEIADETEKAENGKSELVFIQKKRTENKTEEQEVQPEQKEEIPAESETETTAE